MISNQVRFARILNLIALVALLGVLSGSLHLQFGIGEQPCPLCLVQRSGMIGLAVGPLLNLLTGIRVRNYAFSILAAAVGGAGSIRQILLHISSPEDPGYGPQYLGFHLYTWAEITFAIAIVCIAILLLWPGQFAANDNGVLRTPGVMRVLTVTIAAWYFLYALTMTIFILPECGLGMCPADPANTNYMNDPMSWISIGLIGVVSLIIGLIADRRMRRR